MIFLKFILKFKIISTYLQNTQKEMSPIHCNPQLKKKIKIYRLNSYIPLHLENDGKTWKGDKKHPVRHKINLLCEKCDIHLG